MIEFIQLLISGIMIGALYSLLGIAIVLVYKATRVVSLAHGQILTFGALLVWMSLVYWGLPPWLCFLIGLAMAAIIGLAIERFTLRPLIGQPLHSAFIMTVAVYAALDGILQLILKGETKAYPAFFPRAPVQLGEIMIPQVQIWGFFIGLVVVVFLALFFQFTRTGLAMRVTAEDHTIAQNLGIRVRLIFSLIWLISGLVAGVSGILLASILDISFVLPFVAFKGLVVALFGGLESLPGAIVAGLLLGIFESFASGYIDPLVGGGSREVIAFVMLLFILLVRPYGLFGLRRIERV
jgi:branched-chain amino acid transport system permease protein